MSTRTKLEILFALIGCIAILFALYTHEVRENGKQAAYEDVSKKTAQIVQERQQQAEKATAAARTKNDKLRSRVDEALQKNNDWAKQRTPSDVVSSLCGTNGIRCITPSDKVPASSN